MQSDFIPKGYHKLLVWQKSKSFNKLVYQLTETYPKIEAFGLTSQTRRASLSILLNIAEGARRKSKKEFLHFLDIADGSLVEVEACLEIALDLGYILQEDFHKTEEYRREIAVMLVALIKSIKKTL